MKEFPIPLIFFLGTTIFFVVVGSYQLPDDSMQPEERLLAGSGAQSALKIKTFLRSEDFKAGVPEFIKTLGNAPHAFKIDYGAPPGKVMKNIGDAVIPLISTGLALIPGGALIGGVVGGVWSLFSPFLGGGSEKSPMERMIDNIKDELDNLKSQISELAKKIPEQMRKEMNAKFSSVIHRAIQGELKRNEYICNKYALISQSFSGDLKNHAIINESLRVEMIAYIQDCDNFLKDSTEAFVYPEFADVLWVPSVIATFVRAAFLSEICNYGPILNIDESIIKLFWSELKADLKRNFQFSAEAVIKRLTILNQKNSVKRNLTVNDYEGCRLQRQLLYFDREMYHYGIPKEIQIFNDEATINVADYAAAGNNEPRHLQVLYNEVNHPEKDITEGLLNCFTGSSVLTRVPIMTMTFRVTYVVNKFYEVRLLYFTKEEEYYSSGVTKLYSSSDRRVQVIEESGNTLNITIDYGTPNENSFRRFTLRTAYHGMVCAQKDKVCYPSREAFKGTYIVETVTAFNIKSNKQSKGKLVVQNEQSDKDTDLIIGVELIVLPSID